MFFEESDQPRTDGTVGCHAGGREFDSESKNYIRKWLDFHSSRIRTINCRDYNPSHSTSHV